MLKSFRRRQNPARTGRKFLAVITGSSLVFKLIAIFILQSFTFLVPVAYADTGTGTVSLTTSGTAATENFNTLATSGTANTTLPTGWYITETGGGARDNEQYAADTGGSGTGDTYSYGAAGNTDRSLGGLQSGTLIPVFGAKFTNNTGSTITSLDISYTGEQWRLGTAARTDRIDFQISTDATDLSTGTYTDVDTLDFTTPNTATTGAKDGNAAANRTVITNSISGLSIANGATFFIRWTDLNASGADDGLSVDDFSITPQGGAPVDNPPTVTGTVPADNAINIAVNANVSVTFSEPVNATSNSFQISCATSGAHAFALSGGATTFTLDPTTDFTQGEVCTVTVVAAQVTDQDGTPDQMAADFVFDFTVINTTPVAIHDIQGSGTASPLAGQTVTTTGIVTLLRTSTNNGGAASGFFLQAPDASADADPNTSEGIFIFTSSVPTVAIGDSVSVTGTVVEFNGLTEINMVSNVSTSSTGNPLPTPVTLTTTILDPAAQPTQPQLEKYEGMRLSAASLTTVAPNDNFYDVHAVITGVARPLREPGIPVSLPVPPDPTSGVPDPNVPRWDENPERILVDTNARAGAPLNGYTSNVVFTNVAGPLDFAFGEYRLIPDATPTASTNLSAVPVPTPTANEFTVGSFNVENFNNNATQRQKAALAIRDVMQLPAIIGMIEIFDLADLQALATEVNTISPGANYQPHLVEADGTSEDNDQDVGYLVDTARVGVNSVVQRNATETFTNPNNGMQELLNDRPPLVLYANVQPAGANVPVVVVVNHLRSFIDIDQDPGDGPRVREKRKRQAESLAALLEELQTDNPTTSVISVGDYNAYQFNDGYTDLIATIKGNPTPDDQVVVDQSPDLVDPDFVNLVDGLPASERYSFIFEGTPQALDHILINTVAQARNTRFAIARNNADFPEVPASAFASNSARPERNSDHDMPVAYFLLDATPPTVTINQASGQADPTSVNPVNFTVVFSESVTGFDNGDISLSGTAGVTNIVVTGSGTTYNVAITVATSGTVIPSVNAGAAQDAAGNASAASTSTDNTVVFDSNPSVIINQASGQADPTSTNPINFTVVFSEDVTGFDNSDISLSGTAGVTNIVVTGSGANYNVAITVSNNAPGTVIPSVNAGAAMDASGNQSKASTSTDNSVTFTASAAPQITFVSSAGNDANPCTRTAPCRAFQRAHDVVTSGGEVVALDSAGYGSLIITKSVTISGEGIRAAVTTTAAGTDGITINAPGATVILRGLTVTGLSGTGANGIVVNDAASVYIEQCVVTGFSQTGILYQTNNRLFVADTISRSNGGDGLNVSAPAGGTARINVHRSRFARNVGNGINLTDNTIEASITNSVMSENGLTGLRINSSGNTRAQVSRSTAAGNNSEGFSVGGSGTSQLNIEYSTARGNADSGMVVFSGTIRVSNSVSTNNQIGFNHAGGTFESRGNNTVRGNAINTSGTISPLGSQ